VFVPASDRNLNASDVLDVAEVCRAIGPHAVVLADAEAIITHIRSHASEGDDVLILSNGGFDGIHQRLLTALSV
jgi:UDP-N-acetylmuramate: L-alanyl-gamma-D-glutamyl-meso-diaminopimelate ligase